jgi:hypothetical protein
MIKLDLTNAEMQILVDLLETGVSDIHAEIRQTDNRDYRKMHQEREILLKNLQITMTAKLDERRVAEIA